jgi:hypothetical protein
MKNYILSLFIFNTKVNKKNEYFSRLTRGDQFIDFSRIAYRMPIFGYSKRQLR